MIENLIRDESIDLMGLVETKNSKFSE